MIQNKTHTHMMFIVENKISWYNQTKRNEKRDLFICYSGFLIDVYHWGTYDFKSEQTKTIEMKHLFV